MSTPTLHAEEVAVYLETHPEFFEHYADLLAQIFIPHPHGGRAISITERQILTLREKSRAVETKLSELIRFGEENDALSEKMQRLTLALLSAPTLPEALAALEMHLKEDFSVPHVAIRFWDGAAGSEVSASVRSAVGVMTHPYCGANAGFEAVSWLGEAASHIRSLALIPLPGEQGPVGLLVLASEDAERFYPDMGTVYLSRLGELAGALQARARS